MGNCYAPTHIAINTGIAVATSLTHIATTAGIIVKGQECSLFARSGRSA